MYYGFVYLILLVAFFSGVLVVERDAGTTLSVFFEGSHAYVYAVFNGVNPGSWERVIGGVFQGYSFTVIESSGGLTLLPYLLRSRLEVVSLGLTLGFWGMLVLGSPLHPTLALALLGITGTLLYQLA
jgi:hypothetical protein